MEYPYALPPALPVPVEGAPVEDWNAYNNRAYFVYSLQVQAEEARLLAEHRATLVALREREVAAHEAAARSAAATTQALEAQARDEGFLARFKLLADIVERRGTDRTASGNLDQVKLTADMKAILAVAHATLVDLASALVDPVPAPAAAPGESPAPGLSG